VARIAASLAQVSVQSNKLDQARTMIELAAAALTRGGGDPEIEIEVMNARALAASAAGDHATAIELVTKLIASMSARRGAHSMEVTELWVMLAREDAAAGRMKEAQEASAKAEYDQVKAAGIDQVKLGQKIMEAFEGGETARGIELSQQYVAMARESGNPEMAIDAATSLAQAYELSQDYRMMLEAYQNVLALLDKQPNGGPHEHRGPTLEAIGIALIELHRTAEAVEPLRKAMDEDAKAGAVNDDQRASAATSLARALLELGKPHEARVLIEPIAREVATNPGALPQRRASTAFRLAQALWDDGGKQDRARALALADDADRDYLASLERLKSWPDAVKVPIHKRLDELREWRKRRQ
jgi:tetratricopeptide (TPR) repeat protein